MASPRPPNYNTINNSASDKVITHAPSQHRTGIPPSRTRITRALAFFVTIAVPAIALVILTQEHGRSAQPAAPWVGNHLTVPTTPNSKFNTHNIRFGNPLLHARGVGGRAASLASLASLATPRQLEASFYNYTMARTDTHTCNSQPGLECRAILHVENGPTGTVVYAGMMIYATDKVTADMHGRQRQRFHVSEDTRHAIRTLSEMQTRELAQVLVDEFGRVYGTAFFCDAGVEGIGAAVLKAAPVVALCAYVRDPRCYDDFVVAVC